MAKERSRVAREEDEVRKRAGEVEKKIKELSRHIAKPEKYLAPPPDPMSQSRVERFRKYFTLNPLSSPVERRKATRAEIRMKRNQAIFWCVLAFICVVWMGGCLVQQFK